MSFLNDVIFPIDISAGSVGGPGYSTSIVSVASGYEDRNINWTSSRYSYNAAYGVRQEEQLEALLAMFHVANGRAHSFRYTDFLDYKSCTITDDPAYNDQTIGTGDGVETDFQLIKTYASAGQNKARDVTKLYGAVLIGINGVEQSSGFTVDMETGIVTFSVAPGNTLVVTAGYTFHVPVRFDTDTLPFSLETYQLGATEVPLVEVRGE